MQKINQNKIIMHEIETIKSKISRLKKNQEVKSNSKIEKIFEKIENELGKVAYYYNTDMGERDIDFPIRKRLIIKNKKTSRSFSRWLFNNNEL